MEVANNVLKGLGTALLLIAIAFTVLFIIGLLIGLWFNITMFVWHQYGDQTFIYWLLGNALAGLLVLVALW